MKTKKLLSLVLAGTLALGISVPAFASGASSTSSQSQEVSYSATTQQPTISLTMPTTAAVVINPYELAVQVNSVSVYDSVISKAESIENKSNCDLLVSVTPSATLATGVTLAAVKDIAKVPDATAKQAFLYIQFAKTRGTLEPEWASEYSATGANMIPLAAKGTATKLFTLPATNGTVADYLWFKISGIVAKNPTTAWGENDKITPKLSFTFTPTMTEKLPATTGVNYTVGGTTDVEVAAFTEPSDKGTTPGYELVDVKGDADSDFTADTLLTLGTDRKVTIAAAKLKDAFTNDDATKTVVITYSVKYATKTDTGTEKSGLIKLGAVVTIAAST